MFKLDIDLSQVANLAEKLEELKAALDPQELDSQVMDPAALTAQRMAVETTKTVLADRDATVLGLPRFYLAKPEDGWLVIKAGEARRILENGKVEYLNVDRGTANEGRGYILPTNASVLYIPLNRRAAAGWNTSLKPNIDYILRKRVRGIRPRRITPKIREKARGIVRQLFGDYARAVVQRIFTGGE